MKRFINWLFAVAASAAASMPCWADFQRGEELHHGLTVCIEKADAIAIVDADAKDGRDAAAAMFEKIDKCQTVNVNDARVGRVVHTATVKREGAPRTMSVVEIIYDGKVVAYFLTSQTITARLDVKPERNT